MLIAIFCSASCDENLTSIDEILFLGERELVEFLAEEIQAEKKAQKVKTIPTEIEGFKVKLDGSEIELVKKGDTEEITVSFNINHTIDQEEEPEINMNADKPDIGELKSKPTFEVDIKRGSQTLSFTCSFVGPASLEPQENEYNDIFTIDEVTLFEGEWSDKTYAVAGEVLDGYLYDLLMNLLEEKGISNEFVEKVSEVATTYEHSAYIGLLEGISRFTAGK